MVLVESVLTAAAVCAKNILNYISRQSSLVRYFYQIYLFSYHIKEYFGCMLSKLGSSAASEVSKLGSSAASEVSKLGSSAASEVSKLYINFKHKTTEEEFTSARHARINDIARR